MSEATMLIIAGLMNFVRIYSLLLIVRILLTWFPTMEWANQAAGFLSPITDPYLNIFRSFIPPIGGLDFSAILALLLLNPVLTGLLASIGSYTAYSASFAF